MKMTSFFQDDSSAKRSARKNDSLFLRKSVLLFSVLLNVFFLIWYWRGFNANRRRLHGEPVLLTRDMVSLDYLGTAFDKTTNLVDRFVLSNHLAHAVFTYDAEHGFQQATYISGRDRVSHSTDFFDVSGEELSSALVVIPPGRTWTFNINRCEVDGPWKLQREILFSDSYDPSYLFLVETALVHSNRRIQ